MDDAATGDHEVAAQELESFGPPEDALGPRVRRRAETFERHLHLGSRGARASLVLLFPPVRQKFVLFHGSHARGHASFILGRGFTVAKPYRACA